jgi:hypothetical protein
VISRRRLARVDSVSWQELPFVDAGRLTAKYRLAQAGQMKERYSPLDLEWDPRLTR